MSKQGVKTTSSTLAESMRFSEVSLSHYNFSMKVGSKILQVQIEITSDSLIIEALETAIDYFVQIYYDQDINEKLDNYEVYSADPQGNPLQTKFKTDQTLSEIDCQNFALIVKKKGHYYLYQNNHFKKKLELLINLNYPNLDTILQLPNDYYNIQQETIKPNSYLKHLLKQDYKYYDEIKINCLILYNIDRWDTYFSYYYEVKTQFLFDLSFNPFNFLKYTYLELIFK